MITDPSNNQGKWNTMLHIQHIKPEIRHNPYAAASINMKSYFILPYVHTLCTKEQEQCYTLLNIIILDS